MDTLIIEKDYITDNYIIGDSMEKCLRDFIFYLKNKKQIICALERYINTKENDTSIYVNQTIFNNEPIYKPLFDRSKNNEPNFIDKIEIHEEITQEDIDEWCKPFILPNSRDQEDRNFREIYTKSTGGILYKYCIRFHSFYNRILEDTVEYPKDIVILRIDETVID